MRETKMLSKLMTKKRLEIIYDALCDKIDDIFKLHNPCQFNNGKCVRGYHCCGGCNHHSNTGCTTKCLPCKMWLCSELHNNESESILELELDLLKFRMKYDYFIQLFKYPIRCSRNRVINYVWEK
jgi:hypothetical protein